MIKKLESAGLGFYVKATETQQKLGGYSVLHTLFNDLQASMLFLPFFPQERSPFVN